MPDKKLLLIINPIAGTSSKKGIEESVTDRLSKFGWGIDTMFTQCKGDATRLASQAVNEGYYGVLAAGGDGTVNETAIALCDTGVALGIIPCGSGNGLARHLNIPIDVDEALQVVAEDNVAPIDYGKLNGHHFFCTCGVGFDAMVSERFSRHSSRGLVTYVRSMLEEYHRFEPAEYTITIDGDILTERAFVIAACNASQYGNNAYIAPDAKIDDGLLDITIIQAASPIRTCLVGLDMMTGFINKNTIIRSFRAKAASIACESEGPLHIDGEPMRLDMPLDISCHQHGLKVFTPSRQPQFMPIITPVTAFMRDFRLSIKHLLKL